MKRPLSITIIAYWNIVGAAVLLLSSASFLTAETLETSLQMVRVSATVLFIQYYSSQILNIVTGIGLLKGKNWARVLLIYSGALFIIINLFILKDYTLLSLSVIVYLVYLYFLTRPSVVDFFTKKDSEIKNRELSYPVAETNSNIRISLVRKIFSIVLFVAGGYLLIVTMFISAFPVDELNIKILIIGIFGSFSLILHVMGVLLWGKKRWRITSGMVLSFVGGFQILTSLIIILILHSPMRAQLPDTNSGFFSSGAINILFIGGLFLLIPGMVLIRKQLLNDKKTAM